MRFIWLKGLAPLALAALAAAAPAQQRGPGVFAPGVISTAAEEYRVSFTTDGATAFFARSEGFFPATRKATIYVVSFAGGAWGTPEVAPFSGTYPDIDPFVAPDGMKVYFSSIRPVDGVERKDADLWVVERAASGWGEPRNLGSVNTAGDELFPSLDRAGTLYFASDRPGGVGGWDLYSAAPRAGGGFDAPANLERFNTELWDFNPAISPDGKTLVFTSLNRPLGQGLGDLYVSHFFQGYWTSPRGLGPLVNTKDDEYHASFSPNGKFLFFVRRPAGAAPRGGDLYAVALGALDGETQRPDERPLLGPKGKPDPDRGPNQPGPASEPGATPRSPRPKTRWP
jgi:hypothetical protein